MPNIATFYDTFYIAIKNCWPMLTLFVVIITIIRLTHVLIHNEKITLYKEFYGLLAIVYFLLLYYLLLSTEGATRGFNIIPFQEITRYKIGSRLFFYNVLGNIALFIPFGLFVSDYLKAKKTTHILLISTIISSTAEIIQYKIGRAFDIDDIILNVAGAIIGFILYRCIQTIKHHLPKLLDNNIFYNIIAFIVLIIIIILFGSIWGIRI